MIGRRLAGQNLMAVGDERSRGEEAKHPNDCFAVRNVAAPIYAIRKFKNRFDAVLTVSEMRYRFETREVNVSLLLTKDRSLYHPSSWFGIVKGFFDCFNNVVVTKSLRHKIFEFEKGRNALRFGEELLRFPQEGRWPADNSSGIRSKYSPTESSFCFICAPDTAIADWLCCFIPFQRRMSTVI
jgi:hypothetical protein